MMTRCSICDAPITGDGRLVYEKRAKRRSSGRLTRDRCTDCAIAITGRRRHKSPRVEPRYCTCAGTIRRTPGLREQCDGCLRRIDPRYDDLPGDVIELATTGG